MYASDDMHTIPIIIFNFPKYYVEKKYYSDNT